MLDLVIYDVGGTRKGTGTYNKKSKRIEIPDWKNTAVLKDKDVIQFDGSASATFWCRPSTPTEKLPK